MKVKRKLVMSVIGLLAIGSLINPIKSNAALQANKNPGNADAIGNWLLKVRKMESTGGTLGLSDDTINSTNLTSTTKNSLDVHMQKNTEYGAMAILSASAYGNQNKISDGDTTTGNKTGIYIKLNKEWTAAGLMEACVGFVGANPKYKNTYQSAYVAKVGDAITETNQWHNGVSQWAKIIPEYHGVVRAWEGSIFSYWVGRETGGTTSGSGYEKEYNTRACIVIGNDF